MKRANNQVEDLGERRFKRIAAVGVDYLYLAIEALGLELDRVENVQKIVREFAEIVPDGPVRDQRPPPQGAA